MRLDKLTANVETLEELLKEFITFKRAKQVSARTLRDYERYLTDFLSNSQNSMNYGALSKDVLTYFANIPDTSPARYNHPYEYLSCFFNWAVSQGKLQKNPITSQGLQKKRDDGNIKPASIEDIKRLLDSFDKSTFAGFRNYVITLVMIDTGIRTSELRRLVDSDFDAGSKQIVISKHISKTRKQRVVYLSESTAKQVSKLISFKPTGWSELIFPTREGNQMTSEGMAREFARQCEKIGVKITPYQFRHTFASYFVAQGGDVFTLQDIMGHADIRMTRRYTELDDTSRRRQHNAYSPINAINGSKRLVNI